MRPGKIVEIGRIVMLVEDNIFYAKRNLVDSIWKEAHIEGIDVTYPETQEIVEGRSVAGLSIDDILAISNLKHAWHYVLDNLAAKDDLETLKMINLKVGEGGVVRYAGDIRTTGVGIGGTKWRPEMPDPERIEHDLAEIMRINDVHERAVTALCYLCRTQAFNDGNKRTAQLFANKILIENGCGVLAIFPDDKKKFGELLTHYYETQDMTPLKNFLLEKAIDNPDIRPPEGYEPTPKLIQVEDIDHQDHAKDEFRYITTEDFKGVKLEYATGINPAYRPYFQEMSGMVATPSLKDDLAQARNAARSGVKRHDDRSKGHTL